jgi:hypothetical protein
VDRKKMAALENFDKVNSGEHEVRTGRLVAAAKAAASAASVGYQAVAYNQTAQGENTAQAALEENEMDIMYEVLMIQFSPQNQEYGLTIETVFEWDEVRFDLFIFLTACFFTVLVSIALYFCSIFFSLFFCVNVYGFVCSGPGYVRIWFHRSRISVRYI